MACCFNCQDREVGCHAKCKLYKIECADNEKRKVWEKENYVTTISRGAFVGNAIHHKHPQKH